MTNVRKLQKFAGKVAVVGTIKYDHISPHHKGTKMAEAPAGARPRASSTRGLPLCSRQCKDPNMNGFLDLKV